MTEYIHSGIAGKINRIVKPHIGNILVTSEFGNAKESTLTESVLKTAVNDINRIKYAVTYKGEKATVDALPTTGNTKGDMWNVTENGHNYTWNGSTWDDLGGDALLPNSGVIAGNYGVPTGDQNNPTFYIPMFQVNEKGIIINAGQIPLTDILTDILNSSSSSSSSSTWNWDSTPVYNATLQSAFFYDDEDTNYYQIPSSRFGNGVPAVKVDVNIPANGSTEPCDFQLNSAGYGGLVLFSEALPAGPQHFELLCLPNHDILQTIVTAFQTGKGGFLSDGWNASSPTNASGIRTAFLKKEDNSEPLITSVAIIHKSLPIDTQIKVYVPVGYSPAI